MSDEFKPYGLKPEVEAAWNYPLFEALMGRRSRRFGFGMELEHGPFVYKSEKEPMSLSEEETALLVAAATGVTGSPNAAWSASNSLSIDRPANAGSLCASPSVEAWARCAAEKASLT